MTGTALLQSYEDSRGFTRDLPGADVLTLISRLVTEHLVRKDGSQDASIAIGSGGRRTGDWPGRATGAAGGARQRTCRRRE